MSYVLSLVVVATVCLTVLAQLCIRHRRVAVRSGSKASVWRSVGHFRSAQLRDIPGLCRHVSKVPFSEVAKVAISIVRPMKNGPTEPYSLKLGSPFSPPEGGA
jgi:hypothetical protein